MPNQSYRVTISLKTGQTVTVIVESYNAHAAQAAVKAMYPGCSVVSWASA